MDSHPHNIPAAGRDAGAGEVSAHRMAATLLVVLLISEHAQGIWGSGSDAGFAVVGGVIGVGALRPRAWPLVHYAFAVFVSILFLMAAPPGILRVPAVSLTCTFVFCLAVLAPFARFRDGWGWLQLGRIGSFELRCMVLLILVTASVLLIWALSSDDLGAGARLVQELDAIPPFWRFAAVVPAFSLFNAFGEEMIYRSLTQGALAHAFPGWLPVTLTVQAAVFASAHYQAGFPNGAVGYGLVLVWGILLGWPRHRTGGMLAPFCVHVAADAIIIGFLLVVLG